MARNFSLCLTFMLLLTILTPAWAQGTSIYSVEFVSTAASGSSMNDAGDVVGTSYTDPGCGWQCLPPQDTVVWHGGVRIVLPALPGFTGTAVTGINNQGWISGYAGGFDFPEAMVWKLSGGTYSPIDLGVLPGSTRSAANGIDDNNRVVGYVTPGLIPFVWSEGGGLVDLSKQGFPAEPPLGISRSGTVATSGHWYRLGDPTSVKSLAPIPPGGWFGGVGPAAINDAGDQARFLSIGTQHPFSYVFRYHHEGSGTWQQIDFTGTGTRARGGVGSINDNRDVTATVSSTGQIAFGQAGLDQPLSALLSTAYQGAAVTVGGSMNASGQILAQVMIGRSQRLVRLTPASACTANCLRVSAVQMTGKFINDPNDPGHCTPLAKNHVVTKVTVTDENGAPLKGVKVTGHYLDDYWMDHKLSANTNLQGKAKFVHDGLACVGAVAFLVDSATKPGRSLDKTTGVLTNYVIPLP